MPSDIYADLSWRGLIHQSTDERALAEWLRTGSRVLYVGFDPTADSLHVGSLLPLMLLRRFQRAGHRPIALVGGATGMIGDPSGKSEERKLLSSEILQLNVTGIERQMRQFLDFDGPSAATLVNNYDWMKGYGYIEFLRDVGKNFPVNGMLAKDSVRSRLERDDAGLSYTEFSYMLLQAYDFVHLHDRYGCQLQAGGSDQWGNITAGIDLARRMRGAQLYGMTCPLLLNSEGEKIGKTEKGTKVWLSAERTSPYQFYQYWRNLPDADAGRCLRYLTEIVPQEIEALDESRSREPDQRHSQIRLAEALTVQVHGTAGLEAAQRATRVLFGEALDDLEASQLLEIFADVPSVELPRQVLDGEGLGLLDAMVSARLAGTKGEARRTVEQGGAYVNNRRVTPELQRLTPELLVGGSLIVLRSGRKKYGLLRFVASSEPTSFRD
ncbi:MAG: tyrosine--tRNA ligase [Pirellulaceae bacterium]